MTSLNFDFDPGEEVQNFNHFQEYSGTFFDKKFQLFAISKRLKNKILVNDFEDHKLENEVQNLVLVKNISPL